MGFFLETLLGGLMTGMLYALVALGFVLIFKASGVFNFAQGAMVLFAALAMARFAEWVPQWLGFDNRVLAVPAATHGNVAVLAFQSDPAVRQWDKLKKHAQTLNAQYHLDFTGMLAAIKAQQDGRNILSFD